MKKKNKLLSELSTSNIYLGAVWPGESKNSKKKLNFFTLFDCHSMTFEMKKLIRSNFEYKTALKHRQHRPTTNQWWSVRHRFRLWIVDCRSIYSNFSIYSCSDWWRTDFAYISATDWTIYYFSVSSVDSKIDSVFWYWSYRYYLSNCYISLKAIWAANRLAGKQMMKNLMENSEAEI